jgi:hypothetical protein
MMGFFGGIPKTDISIPLTTYEMPINEAMTTGSGCIARPTILRRKHESI